MTPAPKICPKCSEYYEFGGRLLLPDASDFSPEWCFDCCYKAASDFNRKQGKKTEKIVRIRNKERDRKLN